MAGGKDTTKEMKEKTNTDTNITHANSPRQFSVIWSGGFLTTSNTCTLDKNLPIRISFLLFSKFTIF